MAGLWRTLKNVSVVNALVTILGFKVVYHARHPGLLIVNNSRVSLAILIFLDEHFFFT